MMSDAATNSPGEPAEELAGLLPPEWAAAVDVRDGPGHRQCELLLHFTPDDARAEGALVGWVDPRALRYITATLRSRRPSDQDSLERALDVAWRGVSDEITEVLEDELGYVADPTDVTFWRRPTDGMTAYTWYSTIPEGAARRHELFIVTISFDGQAAPDDGV